MSLEPNAAAQQDDKSSSLLEHHNTALGRRLLKTHLSVAALGMLILIVSSLTLLTLKTSALRLAVDSSPTLVTTQELETSLQASLAAIRGWMALNNQDFFEDLKDAWQEGIHPSIKKLEEQFEALSGPAEIASIAEIKSLASDLAEWQWHIADVVHTPGNSSSTRLYSEHARLLYDGIGQGVSSLITLQNIALQTDQKSDQQKLYNLITAIAEHAERNKSALLSYIISQSSANLSSMLSSQETLEDSFHQLEAIASKLSLEQKNLLAWVGIKVAALRTASIDIQNNHQTKYQDVARYLLEHRAVPIAQQLIERAHKIKLNVAARNKADINQILIVSQWATGIMVALFLFLAVTAYITSSRSALRLATPILRLTRAAEGMAAGTLNTDIEVNTGDEIEELANSFNRMRESSLLRQKELEFSEARSRSLIDDAADAIITICEKGIIQSFNQTAQRLFGYTEDEVIGKNVSLVVSNMHKFNHDRYLKNYLETGEKKVIGIGREVMAQHKNGSEFPIHLSVSETNVNGQRLFTGITRDISAAKQQEQELKDKNERIEQENRVQSCLASLGKSIEETSETEVFGHQSLQFLVEELAIIAGAFYTVGDVDASLFATHGYSLSQKNQRKFRHDEGLVGRCIQSKKPIEIDDIPEAYFSIGSSLGELLPKHLLFTPLFHGSRLVGVLELASLKPIDTTKKTLLHPICEMLGVKLSLLLTQEKVHNLLAETKTQAQVLQVQQEELRVTNEELEERTHHLEASESQLKMQKEELRCNNEELQNKSILLGEQFEAIEKSKIMIETKAADLERVSRYKSDFLASMSHELRTPLNSILVLSKILSDNRTKHLDLDEIKYASTIYNSGNDLLALIGDILDLSKIEAGKQTIDITEVDLLEFIQKIKAGFERLFLDKKLELKLHIDASAPTMIRTDGGRLEQIIKNFLSNALKFTDEGNVEFCIRRPAPSQEFSKLDPKLTSLVEFSVIDSGIGIPEDQQEMIFNAFQQVDSGNSRKYGGTGLGLSITRELSYLLGGEVQLTSIEGKGSTFSLFLDENFSGVEVEQDTKDTDEPDQEMPLEDNNGHEVDLAKLPVLIVEDDPILAESISALVLANGINSDRAENNDTAFELLTKNTYSAIILDLNLAKKSNGITLLQTLKQQGTTPHTIIYTGKDLTEQELNEIRKYTSTVVMKGPHAPDRLIHELLKYIGKSKVTLTPEKSDLVQNLNYESEALTGKTILIVDDDMRNLFALSSALGQYDMNILMAQNGKEALATLHENKYIDLVLMDIMMPEMDGYEATKLIRKDISQKIPIVALTAKAMSGDKQECLDAGANDYLTKPVDIERLLTVMQTWIRT